MQTAPRIAGLAALIGDNTRATMLTALMGGTALTATELALGAGVTKQTASAHLARLQAARLLVVERQGRHRYFRLADREVALLLERLMGVAHRLEGGGARHGPADPALRKARVCYDHLAGELGVLLFDSFERRRWLRTDEGELGLTGAGEAACREFGLPLDALAVERRPLCRACLDWSVRRHHLAGAVGAAILERCLTLRWARRARDSRAVVFSAVGELAFRERFRLS